MFFEPAGDILNDPEAVGYVANFVGCKCGMCLSPSDKRADICELAERRAKPGPDQVEQLIGLLESMLNFLEIMQRYQFQAGIPAQGGGGVACHDLPEPIKFQEFQRVSIHEASSPESSYFEV